MMGQAGSTLTAAADVAESALLGGRVRLRQPVKGYRAGMDAALLAAAVDAKPGERLIEAGCGAGAVLMQVGARRPGVTLAGLERDLTAAGLGALAASDAEEDAGSYILYRILNDLPDGAASPSIGLIRAPSNVPDAKVQLAVKTAATAIARHLTPLPRLNVG